MKNLNPGELGKNHQLLAYAYTASGHDVTLHLYDPNQPGTDAGTDNVFMKFNDGDVSQRIVVEHNIEVDGRPVYCFVRMDGKPRMPTVSTRPRLSALERRARRVHIAREQQTTLSSKLINSGRRLFPVWPDCGEAEFNWNMHEDTVSTTLTAATPYYDAPIITWLVNGVRVLEGSDQELLVQADVFRPDGDVFRFGLDFIPEEPFDTDTISLEPAAVIVPLGARDTSAPFDAGVTVSRTVKLRTSVNGNRLEIVNDPTFGNYSLVVQVRAREGDDASTTTSRSTAVDIVGLRVVIEGYEAASAECWKNYLNRHRDQATPVGAVAALLYSQLGRPADPLWDPDPSTLNLGNIVEQVDPKITEIGGWIQEVKDLATAAQHAGPGHGGHVELTAAQLQAQLAAQLGGLTGPL